MGITEDIADGLAKDAIEAADRLGDDRVIDEVSRTLSNTSQTTQEAFLTAVRVRLAERRARGVLLSFLKDAPEAPKPD
ncbi:hypothetical protein RM543_09460 [Roseicyclus sp. F158]|uniref:Uncharacterized protein n=1 Tax=Tropicimonas omnivorans TaxID=3075590 RepID=A0ABU3DGR6_9RHOB|nr:hypothetical protein [Roseicyclus sp. F158]MDT0682913.1 hypothetical protein [Roseicyclus sp. F158]